MYRRKPAVSLAHHLRGLAGFALVSLCLVTIPTVEAANHERTVTPSSIELAQAFTAALNAHDVDALVEMFTDEDSGPTVNADRYAWQRFEIRLWAQQQVAANIHVEAYDFQVTEHGAAWNADVFRNDWQEWGVSLLPVTNTIWVHEGKLADFTSQLRDGRDAERLSSLWEPGMSVRR
jgi:hypothetical protein